MAGAVLVGVVLWWLVRNRLDLGTSSDRATFRTLHTASLAAPPLRDGLTTGAAEKSLRYLRALLGAPAVALTDLVQTLAWDGGGDHHRQTSYGHATATFASGSTSVDRDSCHRSDCSLRDVITAPLT
ncbi:MAG: sensor histidine kinase, partial [Sciscionella sp.]